MSSHSNISLELALRESALFLYSRKSINAAERILKERGRTAAELMLGTAEWDGACRVQLSSPQPAQRWQRGWLGKSCSGLLDTALLARFLCGEVPRRIAC